ncbi:MULTISPECIES: DNA cytosine methyltransferase [Okeania]|uniref:Cytosine-specific methyltransferase n=1 Tax=Okeania hirsuta TaxID=1458930 RepID=A0A3N6MNX4_9CYAN|nr:MULTISPECIES: DNA cytosine methyltransferase [Okeania]NET14562.1 DNA cytosine methyltransferase [Okeania sp. SIO1H6]NES79811.1 DNA cytosine methyltransferase [Okeania sp. SIO1H4]NET23500.1 DNA cytosine methyltransferase [Okeania sp. SIO1H5]NET76188.1 DNA cytosine methyltransferase [Okeania sp. SIO1F9]NET97310.1 DNA cytosine methyltransferase [Okeania sp. SIO1H2]
MTQTNKLKAIELFAGIGGFRLGMKAANIDTIWANDISELCCQIYQSNFSSGSIVLDDINKINLSEIPEHDILTAGFPCQPFSQAGKKMGIRDRVRGTLFQRIVEIIQAKKPKYFLLENVKRILTMEKGYHFRIILNALASLDYFIEWRIINPINFGIPQNRDRIFIFGTWIKSIQKTPDLEKLSVFLTDNDLDNLPGNDNSEIEKYMEPIINFRSKNYHWGIAYQNKMYSQSLPLMPDVKPRKKLKDILQDESEINPQFDFTSDTLERIKQSKTVNRYCNGVEILYNQGGGARLGYTIFGINGVTSTLTASTSRHYERYQVGNKFRRLTNIEYARLMGFPDNWCRVAKIYNQYALYGNSVVPDCVEWIGKRIGQQNFKFKHQTWQQLTLF